MPAGIGGTTIAPGPYKPPISLAITGNVTLDGQMDPNAALIFQMASTFTANSSSSVRLINRANACNVFWQVRTSATFDGAAVLYGTFMAKDSVSFGTGVTLTGRALASSGAVTLLSNTITNTSP